MFSTLAELDYIISPFSGAQVVATVLSSRTTSFDERSSVRSREDVWFLKEVPFKVLGETRTYKIITQNFNGSVSHLPLVSCCAHEESLK